MEHSTTVVLHNDHHAGGGKKEIYRVTLILTVLTILELALGFWMMGMEEGSTLHYTIKGFIIILMLAKAFYIVGYFMHLKHEVRNLIMTIVVPLFLFVWFIIAFLSDGHSYNQLRRQYTPFYDQKYSTQMQVKEHEEQHEKATEKDKEEYK